MGRGTRRDWLPALGPAAVGVLFFATGHPLRALILIGVSAFVAALIAVGVDVAGLIARAVVHVGHALSVIGGGAIFLALFVPAWAWSKVRRRSIAHRGRRGEHGWVVRSGAAAEARALAGEPPDPAPRLSVVGRLMWVVGCVVAVLALNYGVGWLFDTATGRSGPNSLSGPTATTLPPVIASTTTVPGASTDGTTTSTTLRPVPYDPRSESPAMADYPWADQYFDDMQRAPTVYWPYTQYRPVDYASTYINIEGWNRRSYRTPGSRDGRPTIWMFGGSTTWGEGQRDDYTIASYLARLAEADGTPIEIANFGQRGWTHFQEMVLYEQRLALDPVPDLAIFYDGVNETPTQSLVDEAVPSHFQVAEEREARGERTISTRLTGPAPAPTDWIDDAARAYSEHSFVDKVVRWFSPAASAAPAQEPDDAEGDPDEVVPIEYTATPEDGTDAGKVYERSKFITLALSRRDEVRTLLYWQPAGIFGLPELNARDQVTAPTIDISEMLFDHREVLIDNVHTNEEGARLVAERIWEDLKPEIERWYRDNG